MIFKNILYKKTQCLNDNNNNNDDDDDNNNNNSSKVLRRNDKHINGVRGEEAAGKNDLSI